MTSYCQNADLVGTKQTIAHSKALSKTFSKMSILLILDDPIKSYSHLSEKIDKNGPFLPVYCPNMVTSRENRLKISKNDFIILFLIKFQEKSDNFLD